MVRAASSADGKPLRLAFHLVQYLCPTSLPLCPPSALLCPLGRHALQLENLCSMTWANPLLNKSASYSYEYQLKKM